MRCASCGHACSEAARFCEQCGRRLLHAQPVALTVAAPLAEKIRTGGRASKGERKQVTVLFADVKESMDLAAVLDPEEWRRIMDRFFSILCDGVHRYEGTVDKFTGDGIMALFGAPIAHEDHARRACLSALELRDELAAYAADLRRTEGLSFSVRMGLNSGEVVVGTIGDDLSLEYTAVGHTVGLAARMESLAEPGKVYVTEHTAALVGGYFDVRDLGPFAVKGVPQELSVYELEGVGALRTRLEVSAAHGFSRFVGRDRELAAMEEALEHTIAGDAEIIAVVGEAGVGKSRLCHEFVQRCQAREVKVFQAHGLAHARAVSFLPVLELLRGYFAINDHDDERTAREKVAGPVLLLDESFREALPPIFEFLGIGDPEQTLRWLDPEARQRQVFAAFNRLIRLRSQQQPCVWLVEDLQWLDRGSEAFLRNLAQELSGTRTMLLVNFRPEYQASWMKAASCRELSLSPLGREASDVLLDDLLGGDPAIAGLASTIRERTGGNPLFMEESVRVLVQAGTLAGAKGDYRLVGNPTAAIIPPTVQAVLAARIDRLGEREKGVLQTASVIGGVFAQEVLARVSELPEDELADALETLVAAEFLSEQRRLAKVEYTFKHALTQDVAYHTQLASRRADIHGAVASAIEELYPDRRDELAALLAHHLEAAGDDRAAKWRARAAVWLRLKNPHEALRDWRKVLELARPMEETPDNVGLRIAAGWMVLNLACRLGLAEGQDAVEFEREMADVYAEARALAERHERTGGLAVLASTYAAMRVLTGHLEDSARHGREAIELARGSGDIALHVAVLPAPVYSLVMLGDLREALLVTEEGLRLAGDARVIGSAAAIVSPYAWLLLWRGLLQGWAGNLAEGRRAVEQALEIAREDEDPETEAFSHMMLVRLAELAGTSEGVLEHGRAGVEVAERAGGAFWRGNAHQCLAIAHVLRGEWDEAIAAIEHALSLSRRRDVGVEGEPLSLALLSRAQLGRGDPRAALAAADAAVALACARGTKGWELYARHHRAQALLAVAGRDGADAAAEEVERALTLVAVTGAQAFEPRLRRELAEIARMRTSPVA
jgi:class 3 adenylate cyclase/tetratricopeptide (TPR) repeat protein